MNKLILIFLLLAPFVYANEASDSNPLFGAYKNSISFSDSIGIRYVEDNSMHNFSLQYSQPNTIFRLPARINLEGIYIKDFKDKNGTDSVQMGAFLKM